MDLTKHDAGVKTFADGTRFLIKWIERILPVIVGGIELRQLIVEGGIENLPGALKHAITNTGFSTVLWKAALVIYFFSWIFGAESDTEMQADVYYAAPHGGRLTKVDIGAILSIAVGFIVLCYVADNYRLFALALTVFWVVNVGAWRYMVGVLKASIAQSYMNYGRSDRYIDMEKVRVAERYVDGNWQRWRFGVGAALALVMDALAFFVDLPEGYAHGSIFLFVVFVEAWIWLMRARAKVSLKVLDDLSERYGDKLAATA